MEHQGLVREGIDALDSFQKDALIKLGKAEHLGGKVVEQLLRDLGCAAGRQICLHHSWAVPEMSLPACASLVVATAHRAGDHTGKGRPPAGPLDRAVLRNSGKKLLGGIEGGLVNDGLMGALRIVLGQLTPVRNFLLLQMVVPVLLLQERVAQVFFVGQHLPDAHGVPPAAQDAGKPPPVQVCGQAG